MRTAKINNDTLMRLSKNEFISIGVIREMRLSLRCTPNDILEFSIKATEERTDQ